MQLHQPRQEDVGNAVALDDPAHDAPARQDRVHVERDLRPERRRADDAADAERRREQSTAWRSTAGCPCISRLKSAPPPVAARTALDGIGLARASTIVRRPELACKPPAWSGARRSRRSSCSPRRGRHHRGEPDGSGAEDGDAAAGRGGEAVEHRAGTGLDPAAKRALRPRSRSLSGSLTTFRSPATACVANDDWPKKCAWTVSAPRERTLVPSTGRADAKLCSKKRWQ